MKDTPSIPGGRARRALLPALLLLALAPLIAACEITFTPTPSPGFAVTSASLQTDYRATIDGRDAYIICDDRRTELSYTFSYRGDLATWRSYLRGVDTGQIAGDVSFTPNDPGVEVLGPSTLRVTYILPRETAPLLQADGATPDVEHPAPDRDIVVVPTPQVIGYTKLYLQMQSYSYTYSVDENLESSRIPVVNDCG